MDIEYLLGSYMRREETRAIQGQHLDFGESTALAWMYSWTETDTVARFCGR
jgi:hypothetical protein